MHGLGPQHTHTIRTNPIQSNPLNTFIVIVQEERYPSDSRCPDRDRCDGRGTLSGRLLVKEAPEVLVLHLKRFRFDAAGSFASKSSHDVEFKQ